MCGRMGQAPMSRCIAASGRKVSPPSDNRRAGCQFRESANCAACSCLSVLQRFCVCLFGSACRYPCFYCRYFRDPVGTVLEVSQISPHHQIQSTVRSSKGFGSLANPRVVADMEEIDLYGEISLQSLRSNSDKIRGAVHIKRCNQGGDQEGLPQGSFACLR